MGNRVVSQAIPKVDYKALVTGKAVYTDDLAAKDSLVVKVLRSPYAHALIEDINLTRAELVPDIECILTYKDCPVQQVILTVRMKAFLLKSLIQISDGSISLFIFFLFQE